MNSLSAIGISAISSMPIPPATGRQARNRRQRGIVPLANGQTGAMADVALLDHPIQQGNLSGAIVVQAGASRAERAVHLGRRWGRGVFQLFPPYVGRLVE